MGFWDKLVENKPRLALIIAELIIIIIAMYIYYSPNQNGLLIAIVAIILEIALVSIGSYYSIGCGMPDLIKKKCIPEIPRTLFIVLFTILFTFIISGAFSLFPFPAPAMVITEPKDGAHILVPGPFGPKNDRNGTMFHVNLE